MYQDVKVFVRHPTNKRQLFRRDAKENDKDRNIYICDYLKAEGNKCVKVCLLRKSRVYNVLITRINVSKYDDIGEFLQIYSYLSSSVLFDLEE